MSHRFLDACRRRPVDRTPIWLMRQAGRYLPEYRAVRAKVSFLELCKTPDLAAEVTLQPVDILGVDAAILFSDILVVCEAMGMELILEDQGPQFPSPLRTWAGVLGPEDYARFGAPYIARLIGGLKRNPREPQPVIVFGVETGELLGQLAATGADVVGVDWRVTLDEARGRVGPGVALQGNLDPATLFLPLREQEKRVARVLELADAAGPAHICNLGHGVLVGTSVENVKALARQVHAHTPRR